MTNLLHLVLTAAALIGACTASSALGRQINPQDVTTWPKELFKTIAATPPVFNITKSGKPLAPGYIVFTPISFNGAVEVAAVIMSDNGDLIWNSQVGSPQTFSYSNLFVQSLDSKPVLHYWTGGSDGPMGYGHISILDETYTEIYRVCPQVRVTTLNATHNVTFPCYADAHESVITERGSMIISMYNITQADLTSVTGSADGWVYDSLFFEVDIKTNKTLFHWSALEAGIPFSLSKASPLGVAGFVGNGTRASPYDWFHINSVQAIGDGYLVNGRHMWTTYMLNSSGAIQWELQVIILSRIALQN
jgi:hypothetical protein